MRNRFVGHYRPTDTEFKKLWSDCLFLPDANILLHLFRYGAKTRAQVLETLEQLKPRVWIPYRVGFEFHRRWRDVDQNNRDAYEKLKKEIESYGRKMGGLFDEYTRHQTIDAKSEQKTIDEFVKGFLERLSASQSKHPSRKEAEQVFLQVSELVGDAIGERPSDAQLEEMIKDGEKRFAALIPPGYRDSKTKEGQDKYGDYFIWKEALDRAKETEKPIVIITDDVKEDWWQEFRGEKIGPRPELVEEMKQYANQQFYLYTLSQFLDYAETFLNRKIDAAAIDEIKSDEKQLREVARRTVVRQSSENKELRNYLWRPRTAKVRELLSKKNVLQAHASILEGDLDTILSRDGWDGEDAGTVRQLLKQKREVSAAIAEIDGAIRSERASDSGRVVIVSPDQKRGSFSFRAALKDLSSDNEEKDDGDKLEDDE